MPVGTVRPGDLAGESAAIVGRRDHCVLRARVETRLLVVPREAFLALIEAHPGVALALLRDMVGVVRALNGRVARLRGVHDEFDRIRCDLLRFVI